MATGTAVDVVMPQMGVSVAEGTITKWLKSEGEPVVADEPLLEISTDKVDTEVPAPGTGVLGQILVPEGETVAVGTRLATILPEGAAAAAAPAAADETPPEPATQEAAHEATAASSAEGGPPPAITSTPAEQPVPVPATEPAPAAPPPDEADGHGEGRWFVSPVVARIAAEHGVDVARVPGTGRGGRVTKKDIQAFLESREAVAAGPQVSEAPVKEEERAAPPPPQPTVTAPAPAAAPAAGEQVEPMTVMRKAIAEHMVRSVATSAHVTTVFEVDMSRVTAIREKLKGEYEQRYGVRLTYLAFISRAVVDTLGKWPRLNAEIRGDQIVTKSFVNLGIAVALDDGKGLIVPVIRNAEERNLLGIARAIVDLADRARSKKLLPDEVHGGTFTITNPGGFGAIAGTPIINQPQVGILDVEAIVKRPVVITDEHGDDAIAIRPMMNLCLTYDHRLVDGAYAAPFMRDLKTSLETWDEEAY
jgi:2-oxoglutarate dehydrogenase E2 component (dihydrolipoamide succinyltransferase)